MNTPKRDNTIAFKEMSMTLNQHTNVSIIPMVEINTCHPRGYMYEISAAWEKWSKVNLLSCQHILSVLQKENIEIKTSLLFSIIHLVTTSTIAGN